MLNFRKLKQDFPSPIIREGRTLFEKEMVVSIKIIHINAQTVRLSCRVLGSYSNHYQSEIEIDRHESMIIDADCDCPYKYDCQHLAGVLFYLEENLNEIIVAYSKETDLEKAQDVDDEEKEQLRETFKEAETKEVVRKGKKQDRELLQEYVGSAGILGKSPFFHPEEQLPVDKAELALIFANPAHQQQNIEIQLALRLPYRSKYLHIPNVKEFVEAVRYNEPLYIGSKRFFFTMESFDEKSAYLMKMVIDFARPPEGKNEKNVRIAQIEMEPFGTLLAEAYEQAVKTQTSSIMPYADNEQEPFFLPGLFCGNLEEPLRISNASATLRFNLESLEVSTPKILINPVILIQTGQTITLEEGYLFACAKPGMLYQNVYWRFQDKIKRKHLRNLTPLREITIPEPLFGTFVENALSELMRFGEVANHKAIEEFVTLPFVEPVKAECDIHYLQGELEASLYFVYGHTKIPAATSQLTQHHILTFVTKQGVLARNLTEEQNIIDDLFQDFIFDPAEGIYVTKTDKKIVEFMTEVIPRNQHRVTFNCPENLLDQFIYDDTTFKLHLRETSRIDVYEVDLKVEGHLNGVTIDQLWECLAAKRTFIELARKKTMKKKGEDSSTTSMNKILVLDLERLAPVVQIFDEIGINQLDNHKEERPLWSLTSIDAAQFEPLPIEFVMTKKLQEIQQQMLGVREYNPTAIPKDVQATFREYQKEGVHWLDRLRNMHLSGILADDMGLGKTLQAIAAVTQLKNTQSNALSIVICPTSLVHNWKEEFSKFNHHLRVLPVDGTPSQRKKLLSDLSSYDVIITSYSLLQKDIDFYKTLPFAYAILDEAQHIKNRGTRNAKSVKMIQAAHRLILTGTPIENSLDELWSLFDFLMPGLLSTYDRFVEKYIRNPNTTTNKNLEALRRKVSPFILRRMKKDVLTELPPVSEITYHCDLSPTQKELYRSYADSAREELSALVKKEGFERVQIHVLATLTRLKQICCHPAIFAKEKAEVGDSAKYDMLMELLQTLIEGKHKTVIFSQYTRMLNIMRDDLTRQGIPFEYLDGSSKNRMSIVKKFNEDETIPVFLVSLKAGGSGLNLVGANAIIQYDLWWNPAVDDQATNRVHRIGQKSSVSAYKLVTLNTIEEKIIELQNRKKGLVKKVISCDEEAMTKLTWEEVLDLLKT